MGRLTKKINGIWDADRGAGYNSLDCAEKLAHYEDLEEQGRLIELPCAVGDRLYFTSNKGDVFDIRIETIDEALFFKDENGNLKKGFYRTKEVAEATLRELEGTKE